MTTATNRNAGWIPVWVMAGLIGLLSVAAIGWLSIPAFLSAFPTRVAEGYWYSLPAPRSLGLYNVLVAIAGFIPPLCWALCFVAWSRPSRGGEVPKWTLAVTTATVVGGLAWHAITWSDGVRYQGRPVVLGQLALSLAGILVMALTAGAALRLRRPSWALAFNAAYFVWLLAVAFPWRGETF